MRLNGGRRRVMAGGGGQRRALRGAPRHRVNRRMTGPWPRSRWICSGRRLNINGKLLKNLPGAITAVMKCRWSLGPVTRASCRRRRPPAVIHSNTSRTNHIQQLRRDGIPISKVTILRQWISFSFPIILKKYSTHFYDYCNFNLRS